MLRKNEKVETKLTQAARDKAFRRTFSLANYDGIEDTLDNFPFDKLTPYKKNACVTFANQPSIQAALALGVPVYYRGESQRNLYDIFLDFIDWPASPTAVKGWRQGYHLAKAIPMLLFNVIGLVTLLKPLRNLLAVFTEFLPAWGMHHAILEKEREKKNVETEKVSPWVEFKEALFRNILFFGRSITSPRDNVRYAYKNGGLFGAIGAGLLSIVSIGSLILGIATAVAPVVASIPVVSAAATAVSQLVPAIGTAVGTAVGTLQASVAGVTWGSLAVTSLGILKVGAGIAITLALSAVLPVVAGVVSAMFNWLSKDSPKKSDVPHEDNGCLAYLTNAFSAWRKVPSCSGEDFSYRPQQKQKETKYSERSTVEARSSHEFNAGLYRRKSGVVTVLKKSVTSEKIIPIPGHEPKKERRCSDSLPPVDKENKKNNKRQSM